MITRNIKNKSPLGTIGQMEDLFPDEWSEDYYEMVDKFEEIKNIKSGDKIGKVDNKYYVHKSGVGSWLTRKLWYQENRDNTIEYLNTDFKIFFRFLDKIMYNTQNDVLNIYNSYNQKIIEEVKKIIPGLYHLKVTYNNETEHWYSSNKKKIIATIDAIILTLFDFNKKMVELKTLNRKNYKTYGMMIPKVRAQSDTIDTIVESQLNTFSI
tara:strand:- start:134 stop:763 length:630 start_codon:yes stop_codon:yes gene_type:complete